VRGLARIPLDKNQLAEVVDVKFCDESLAGESEGWIKGDPSTTIA